MAIPSKAMAVIILAAVIGVWIIAAPFLAKFLIVEKPLDHADAIIVLSGSAVYKERTRKAAELFRNGLAPMIFITNDGTKSGWMSGEQRNIPFLELEQRELIADGVAPDAIFILPQLVAGTDEEAKAAVDAAEAYGIHSLMIVTSAYHSRRALWTFEREFAGKDAMIGIEHPAAGINTPRPAYWYLRPRGWQMVAGEYVKFAVYWIFY
ncbi:MAG: YdcF family protein [Acidobacteria bacterium]|nr:YdcF family protein [Acidobacteriota bacterium]